MDAIPETQYARRGDEFIAYQTLGSGPPDIVFLRSAWNHLEIQWEEPRLARFLTRLGSIGRLIIYDGRGSGMSDAFPGEGVPSFEDWVDDALTVMDAVQAETATIVCSGITTMRGVMLAATHPQRVTSLVIANGFASQFTADDYPFGMSREQQTTTVSGAAERWGRVPAPLTFSADPIFAKWLIRYQRFASAPGFFISAATKLSPVADVRALLPAVQVPTLVIQHAESLRGWPGQGVRPSNTGAGRYLAEHIDGAKYAELPGLLVWDWLYPDPDAVVAEIEQFVLGKQSAPEPDRVLATVLFTDIVDSTSSTAAVGDRRWRDTLDTLDRVVDAEVERHRGKVIKSTGDGHLASFDGPGRAIRCAVTLRSRVRDLGLEIRAGLHTGEVEVRGSDIGGIAVNIARRVCDTATDGTVFVSSSVPPLVAGSQIEFSDRGQQELKGVPGTWQLYEVVA